MRQVGEAFLHSCGCVHIVCSSAHALEGGGGFVASLAPELLRFPWGD